MVVGARGQPRPLPVSISQALQALWVFPLLPPARARATVLAVAHARGHDRRGRRLLGRRHRGARDRGRDREVLLARGRSGLPRRERAPRGSRRRDAQLDAPPRLGPVHRAAAGARRSSGSRAAEWSAARRRSTRASPCAASRTTTTSGPRWACPSGAGRQCLPAFKRLENDLDVRNEWHSQDGPDPHPPAPRRASSCPGRPRFLEACAALGFPRCDDTNDPTTTGVGPARDEQGRRRAHERRALLPRRRGARAGRTCASGRDTLVRRVLFARPPGRGRRGRDARTRARDRSAPRRPVRRGHGDAGHPAALGRRAARVGRAARRGPRRRTCPPWARGSSITPASRSSCGRAPLRQSLPRPAHPDGAPLHVEAERPTQRHDPPARLVRAAPVSSRCRSSSIMCSVGKPRGHGTIEYTSADPRSRPAHRVATARRRRRPAARRRGHAARGGCSRDAGDSARPGRVLLAAGARGDRATRGSPRGSGGICDSGYHPCGTVPMGADDASDADAATDGRGRVRGVEGPLGRRREPHADDPEREHEPHHAHDRRALRRVDEERRDVSRLTLAGARPPPVGPTRP